MRANNIKNIGRKWRVAAAAFVAILLALAISVLCYSAAPANADGGCTITIHVYDPAQEYGKLAGWIWVGGNSNEEKLEQTPLTGEQFEKGGNVARPMQVTYGESDAQKLKSGAVKLGILIVIKKSDTGSWDEKYDKEGLPDVMVDLSTAFDANNHADVYFVRKDTEAFTNIEDAKMALEKITSAKFTSKTAISYATTSELADNAKVTLYNGKDVVATGSSTVSADKFSATATLSSFAFDFSADYQLEVEKFPKRVSVSKGLLVDDVDFIQTFETADTQELEYGAVVTKSKDESGKDTTKTTFRVWSPLASSVVVNIYTDGSASETPRKIPLTKRLVNDKWGGVWETTLDRDYTGSYYTYTVTNAGVPTETIDPYAKACGADGERGLIIDFDANNPYGWENDKHLYDINKANADTPVVWELQIKDFSASPDSGMKYKGKYLAFTEEGTTVPGKPTLKTGIDYLKDLGITYVHLNPTYDYHTVVESDPSVADDTTNYNWGYDPDNYFIPEGSFSTDASRGEVRIKEFKQMVMALHKAGIGVIMDVVYNHTYTTQGQALFDTVPNYYHRLNADGSQANGTGCGNETASERTMFRKYIVESILHWANEYHIDGFRFDLMGCHDLVTLRTVREALDAVDGGKGKALLMYGEPWGGYGYQVPASYNTRVAATTSAIPGTGKYTNNAGNVMMAELYNGNKIAQLPANVAVFNDDGRNGLRGDNGSPGGWVASEDHDVGRVQKMIEGGAGSTGSGRNFGLASRCVAYAVAHDNYTLWDQLAGGGKGKEPPLYYDYADPNRIKQCKLVSAAYLMSSGISFILAGEEMGRTKYGNEDSYNSPQKLNALNWSRQEQFKTLVDHYKALINAKKANNATLFSYSRAMESAANSTGNFSNAGAGVIRFTRGALELNLNAVTQTGYVKINGNTIVNI